MTDKTKGILSYVYFVTAIVLLVVVFGVAAPELIEEQNTSLVVLGFALIPIVLPVEYYLWSRAWRYFKFTKIYSALKEG